MIRYLLCNNCSDRFAELHREDIEAGWHLRRNTIEKSKRPEDLCIEIRHQDEVARIPVPVMVCDGCNDEMPDGSNIIAVTMWQSPEAEPGNWEAEYTQR